MSQNQNPPEDDEQGDRQIPVNANTLGDILATVRRIHRRLDNDPPRTQTFQSPWIAQFYGPDSVGRLLDGDGPTRGRRPSRQPPPSPPPPPRQSQTQYIDASGVIHTANNPGEANPGTSVWDPDRNQPSTAQRIQRHQQQRNSEQQSHPRTPQRREESAPAATGAVTSIDVETQTTEVSGPAPPPTVQPQHVDTNTPATNTGPVQNDTEDEADQRHPSDEKNDPEPRLRSPRSGATRNGSWEEIRRSDATNLCVGVEFDTTNSFEPRTRGQALRAYQTPNATLTTKCRPSARAGNRTQRVPIHPSGIAQRVGKSTAKTGKGSRKNSAMSEASGVRDSGSQSVASTPRGNSRQSRGGASTSRRDRVPRKQLRNTCAGRKSRGGGRRRRRRSSGRRRRGSGRDKRRKQNGRGPTGRRK